MLQQKMVFLPAKFSLSQEHLLLYIFEKGLVENPSLNILGQGQMSNDHASSYYGIEKYFLNHSFDKLSIIITPLIL